MMNLIPSLRCLGLGWLLAAAPVAQAQLTIHLTSTAPMDIPDADPSGVQSTLDVVAPWLRIGSVEVEVQIESANVGNPLFNGDLFMYLTHTDSSSQSAIAVLLNRVGKEEGNAVGYGDSGFAVTFQDTAAQADIHTYRTTLFGNSTTAIDDPGVLTGTWSPDGRETDPANVVTSDARTALLAGFQGLDPNGHWTLFVADLSSGGEARLVSWGLTVTPVPEPAWTVLAAAAGLLGWAGLRRRASAARPAR